MATTGQKEARRRLTGDKWGLQMPKEKKVAGTQVGGLVKIKVTLDHVKPDVVRDLIIPIKMSLGALHEVLQSAMGWENCHPHDFRIRATRTSFGNPSVCDVDEDEQDVSIEDLLNRGVKKLTYNYDFGDDWKHTIVFGRILDASIEGNFPWCTGGRRACPPENCGGPWGYMENLTILSDPKHPEHDKTREWMGAFFDPDHFSIDEVNKRLHPASRSARPGLAKAKKPVANLEKTKSADTRKIPSKWRRGAHTGSEPIGTTFTTPLGFTVTRFTAGDVIGINPGPGFDGKATLSSTGSPSFDLSSFFLSRIPASIRKIDVYTEPIPSTWGAKKMSSFCKENLGLKTTRRRAFLFFNAKRNLLRVYWHDGECEQILERSLFEGTFLVPLTGKSSPWMQVARDRLSKILKARP